MLVAAAVLCSVKRRYNERHGIDPEEWMKKKRVAERERDLIHQLEKSEPIFESRPSVSRWDLTTIPLFSC